MRANGLTILCTVGRPRYPVCFGGCSAERSHLESQRIVSCLVNVSGSARAKRVLRTGPENSLG